MIPNRQAVVIRYRADQPATLRARPFLAYRDYHSLGHKRDDLYGSLPRIEFKHAGKLSALLRVQTMSDIWGIDKNRHEDNLN